MKINTTIDWFACTKCDNEIPQFPSNFTTKFETDKPMRGYQYGFRYPDGRKVSSSDIQGVYIQYSGKVLNSLSTDALEIIKFHRLQGYKSSRIDLAIDAHDSGLSIDSLYQAFKREETETKAKNASIIENTQGGKTLYIGSRQSEAFVRIYDKAKEQNQTGDWKRIEIELKGYKAQEATNMCIASNNLSKLITSIVLGYINFPRNMHYQRIVKSDKTPIKSDKKQTSDTRKWLMNDVISAMVKVYKNGDTSIVYDFMEALSSELNKEETNKSQE